MGGGRPYQNATEACISQVESLLDDVASLVEKLELGRGTLALSTKGSIPGCAGMPASQPNQTEASPLTVFDARVNSLT